MAARNVRRGGGGGRDKHGRCQVNRLIIRWTPAGNSPEKISKLYNLREGGGGGKGVFNHFKERGSLVGDKHGRVSGQSPDLEN